jgi:hypothetical protein
LGYTKIHTHLRENGFKNYSIKNKTPRIRWGSLKFEDLITPYSLSNSFDCDTMNIVGCNRWKPFLCFHYIITTHQFHSTNYRKPLSKNRIHLHKEIMKLHNKGWGYTKIHRHLLKNGFEIGKSRTTVDSIIKKIKKREEFLSQPIIDGIGNFRVEMMEIKYNLP